MIPGMNPKKMQAMMKQLGINQEDIDANRVIIEKDDGNIIIDNPSVIKVNMQGQETFQVSGDISEQEAEEEDSGSLQEDIQTIIEKTGCSEDEAAIELEKANGDMAEAIINLTK